MANKNSNKAVPTAEEIQAQLPGALVLSADATQEQLQEVVSLLEAAKAAEGLEALQNEIETLKAEKSSDDKDAQIEKLQADVLELNARLALTEKTDKPTFQVDGKAFEVISGAMVKNEEGEFVKMTAKEIAENAFVRENLVKIGSGNINEVK